MKEKLNEIFADMHDANIARHFVTVLGTVSPPLIYRSIAGDFYRAGPEGCVNLGGHATAILTRLERKEFIVAESRPERFDDGKNAGYRMALVRE